MTPRKIDCGKLGSQLNISINKTIRANVRKMAMKRRVFIISGIRGLVSKFGGDKLRHRELFFGKGNNALNTSLIKF